MLDDNAITFLIGNAGTGKSFIAINKALSLLESGSHKKIVLLRPTSISEDEKIGYLSGDMQEKISPLIMPMTSIMNRLLGKVRTQQMIENEVVQGYSLGH